MIGRYQTTATDNFYPYIKPQDTGTHQSTRYMAVTSDAEDTGLLIVATGSRLFEANALHHQWRELNNSNTWNGSIRHPYQAKPRPETIIGISYGSRGTGSESCMSNPPLTQYRLPAGNYTYSYTFVPFEKAQQSDITQLSRYYRDLAVIAEGFDVAAAKAGTSIEGSVFNYTGQPTAVSAILAVYNENGALMFVDAKNPATVAGNGQLDVQFDINTASFAGYAFKVFAWDANMIPLCAPFEGKI
jgi:beta-galactosidase